MEFLDEVKKIGLFDIIILGMLDMGYTPTEIASKADISRQTIYDIKERSGRITGLLKGEEK